MILTALLTALVIECLFVGSIAFWPLLVISVLFGLAIGVLGQHNHNGILSIEALAQCSKLNSVNPALKTSLCLALLAISICSGIEVGLLLTVLTMLIQVNLAKLRLREYLVLLSLPVNFLLISALALLFEWSHQSNGVFNINMFGGWLSIHATTQSRTLLVVSRSLGALSCLYLLSLSTPIHEIIGVLRRVRVSTMITDLMYLIHRYLFLLLELHQTMHNAAESRLGFQSYSHSIRSTGMIFANLLIRSFQQANANFDAMESRCFDGEISFLEKEKPLKAKHLIVGILLFCFVAGVAIWGGLT